MSENYTAEDFAQVNRAKRGAIEVASRVDPESGLQWRFIASNGITGWLTDEGMAAGGWTPVVEARPITPDDLAAAWEAAAVPTDDDPIRAGDVCLAFMSGTWIVGAVGREWIPDLRSAPRILSRAPQREPWQDLADVLGDFAIHDKYGDEYPDMLAQMLYERGVRVVAGGDNDE